MWQSSEDTKDILSTLALFVVIEGATVCISFVINLRIDKEWNFDEHGIIEKRKIKS